jgi:biopolymer transport protein ExbD
MFGTSSRQLNTPITGINVTPLVDITLVLLIIFMVTAKLVVSRAMPMDLPKAATGEIVQDILSVELLADGALLINGTPYSSESDMLRRFTEAAAQAQARAVVRAEGTVPHSRVMRALDLLRQGGVSHVAFAVAPQPPVAITP